MNWLDHVVSVSPTQ